MEFFNEAREIWRSQVPRRGQASTVQGELLRAVEKLRDEATRNGNVNWNSNHTLLAHFLQETLTGSDTFDAEAREQIRHDVGRALDYRHPETDDQTYDRLSDRVVEWARAHPGPVPHEHNPALHI